MPEAVVPPTVAEGRTVADATIGMGPAIATWAAGWLGGMGVVALVILAALGATDDASIPQLALATFAAYAVFLAVLWSTSLRHGTGHFLADFAIAFRPIDLVGIPVGVATQLLLVPAVYFPLHAIWPDTFAQSKLEERAQDLADKAGGIDTVLLVLLVVVGAPIVEEIVYRGLLQRSLSRTIGAAGAYVLVALWFMTIHFVPVEYPGLFAAALVFGAGLLITGRLGPSLLAHAAFNLTGLIMVLR